MTQKQKIDLAVFAHNEASNISAVLSMLARQDIFDQSQLSIRVLVLANGCTDDTVAIAEKTITGLPHGTRFKVCDIAAGGKSRTWNEFVHRHTRNDADFMIFCDADIDVPQKDMLRNIVTFVQAEPARVVASSRPVKDIVYAPQALNLRDRMIAAAGGTLDNWRKGVCGQMYILQANVARTIHLPIGLPVEDGFVRAMVLTDIFRQPENLDLIDGDDDIFHVYQSERGLLALIRHQTRIVIGSALNAVVFDAVRASDHPDVMLQDVAQDPDWLARTCKEALPRRYGYVPLHFLTKRLANLRHRKGLKGKGIVIIGFGFDLLVYVIAQVKMARGTGSGYW